MRSCASLLVAAVCLLLGLAGASRAAVSTRLVASGLDFPVFVTAPDGDARLFIVEQDGRILILESGLVLVTPFLDITGLMGGSASGFDERGLLGLAFPPDYGTTGFFYVNYTRFNDSQTIIARYKTDSMNPNLADTTDPNSPTVLLEFAQPFANHNGGTVAFGPDGMLYIGMGDGGAAGDPSNRAQDDSILLGKMLRIDVSGNLGDPYTIPGDNPHVGAGDPLDEIWAKGLRNPYRFSFDRQTGDLYIADVGQGLWEEVDVQPAASTGAENYGWRLKEGLACFNPPVACDPGGLTDPVHVYGHSVSPCGGSITGGYVYRGTLTELQGHYFFADFCSSQIWSFVWDGGTGVTDFTDRTAEFAPPSGSIAGISAFGEDGFGELYIVDRGGGSDGEIYRVGDDFDDDGVPDDTDICPAIADPDQEDEDSDGYGDACDPCLADSNNLCFGVCNLVDHGPVDDPPDQNPLKTTIIIKDLDKGADAQDIIARGFFNPAAPVPEIAPHLKGVHVVLDNNGTTLLDVNIPGSEAVDGGDYTKGTALCGEPTDGWKFREKASGVKVWKYTNKSGQVPLPGDTPPTCTGDSEGIILVLLRFIPNKQAYKYVVKTKNRTLPQPEEPPITQMTFDLVLGQQPSGNPSDQAVYGQCAEQDLVSPNVPPPATKPFCKRAPAAPATRKKVICKGE